MFVDITLRIGLLSPRGYEIGPRPAKGGFFAALRMAWAARRKATVGVSLNAMLDRLSIAARIAAWQTLKSSARFVGSSYAIAAEATGEAPEDQDEPKKNPAAVALGKLGGKKGGKARAAKLTPEQRREIAKKAAAARWSRQARP